MERLSSGFRINRAADDAAGLAVSEKLKAQIGGLNQASRNSQDGISMIQTAEGALDEVQSMMQRMRDLAVQASSDTNSQTERDNINLELGQLGKEINSISMRSKFNGQSLLSGSLTKSQTTAYVGAGGGGATVELSTAAALGGGETVSSISVDGAQSGRQFTLTAGSSAGQLTLSMYDSTQAQMTMADQAGHTSFVTETIDVGDMAIGGSQTLNFSNLGVKITLASPAVATGATIATDLAGGTFSIDTATASGTATLQTGSMQGDETAVDFVNTSLAGGTKATQGAANTAMDVLAASLNTFASAGGATRDNASSLITALDTALGSISSSRATLGAAQNRLQHTIANLGTTSENLSASNSRIRDVDVATESSNMAKNQVLEQAGVSVLAQANQLPQLALKLLG
jgi:flagellin